MKCSACQQVVTWHRPVVYLEYGRGVHVDEFISYVEGEGRLEFERLRQMQCEHEVEESIYRGHMMRCRECGRRRLTDNAI